MCLCLCLCRCRWALQGSGWSRPAGLPSVESPTCDSSCPRTSTWPAGFQSSGPPSTPHSGEGTVETIFGRPSRTSTLRVRSESPRPCRALPRHHHRPPFRLVADAPIARPSRSSPGPTAIPAAIRGPAPFARGEAEALPPGLVTRGGEGQNRPAGSRRFAHVSTTIAGQCSEPGGAAAVSSRFPLDHTRLTMKMTLRAIALALLLAPAAIAHDDHAVVADDDHAAVGHAEHATPGGDFSKLSPDEPLLLDRSIFTPKQVLGYDIGDHFTRYGDLQRYIQLLAEMSDRVVLEDYGTTNQRRTLSILTVTSPENHARLDTILDANRPVERPRPRSGRGRAHHRVEPRGRSGSATTCTGNESLVHRVRDPARLHHGRRSQRGDHRDPRRGRSRHRSAVEPGRPRALRRLVREHRRLGSDHEPRRRGAP